LSTTAPICVEIPAISIPSISLPMGIELQAIADFSKGPPTNCALLSNLMVQLMPTLAGLTCIFKILNVIGALEKFVSGPLNPNNVKGVLDAIGGMSECLSFITGPAVLFETIKDILLLIIGYLKCFVDAIKSILDFQAGIDLNAAQGNPDLLASLQCANDNANTSMQQMMMSLGPIGPLFTMIQPIIGLSGLSIELPSVAGLAGASSVAESVDQLDAMLTELQQIMASIP
jgi:hypothetical protein